jgi:hypothetical protein
MLFCNFDGFVLKWRSHGVVETIHESEIRHQCHDLDNLSLGSIAFHAVEQRISDIVGLGCRSDDQIKRRTFGVAD